MLDKPRRRWLTFSLRTFFAVLTIAGLWIGWNVDRVRKRDAALRYFNQASHPANLPPASVQMLDPALPRNPPPWKKMPWMWQLLGAKPVDSIRLIATFGEQDRWYIESLFPEADVYSDQPSR